MEKSTRGVVIPANPQWSDIGSWESLWDICQKDENNNVLDGNAVTLNAKNSLIHAKEKLIAVAGLENIVVVETDDAILIMNKNDNDSMRELIKKLKNTGAREVA
jgi:mannose-1-phosphate guanylyltransferase